MYNALLKGRRLEYFSPGSTAPTLKGTSDE
jgi:hypothetical protein